MTTLTVPVITADMSVLDAAFTYARHGWYVGPCKAGTKDPGSLLGKGWERQTSRDPEQIAAWFAGSNYGLFLHMGRSGAVSFDVDRPENMPDVMRQAFAAHPAPMQTTRVGSPERAHHVYLNPHGRILGNGVGKLGGAWGEVRGKNGVLIVAPTPHAEGGLYAWQRTGAVPVLPEALADLLGDAGASVDSATDAEVKTFLAEHTAASRPGLIEVWARTFETKVEAGESRHDRMWSILCGAMREARAGYFPAQHAADRLRDLFVNAATRQPKPGSQQKKQRTPGMARSEWDGLLAGAVGEAKTADIEAVRKRTAKKVPDVEQWLAQFDAVPTSAEPSAKLPEGGSEPDEVFQQLDVIRADAVQISRVVHIWRGRIPRGAITLLPGEEGIGKTTVGISVIAMLTRGTLPGEYEGTPRDVIVIAPEDGIAEVFTPRALHSGADLTRIHFVKARIALDGNHHAVILPTDLEAIGELVREHDVALVWVDSLVTSLPDGMRSISYKDVATVLRRLSAWAEREKVAIAAPWHLNKASGSDTAVRIMDSRAFRTAVRSMLLVVADPDAEEGVQQGIVALDKANGSTLDVPALRYRIKSVPYVVDELDEDTGEITEIEASCGVAEWIGEVEGDGRRIAREALTPRLEREDSPQAWLRQYLTDAGETPRADVIAAGEEAGHSRAAITRAATAIRLHTREEKGQDPKTKRPFRRAHWSLPKPTSQSTHTRTTESTEFTGEDSSELTDINGAGQGQSTQSTQSSVCEFTGKTGEFTVRPSSPVDVGPCVRCQTRHLRYGPDGSPMCPSCIEHTAAAPPVAVVPDVVDDDYWSSLFEQIEATVLDDPTERKSA